MEIIEKGKICSSQTRRRKERDRYTRKETGALRSENDNYFEINFEC
jgi:hypothetical protein